MKTRLTTKLRRLRLEPFLALAVLFLAALACTLGEEEPAWRPETPTAYRAETTPVEVYILTDAAGNMVSFGGPYSYGVTAHLTYVLRFWDVGALGTEEQAKATIYKVYTPLRVTGIQQDLESSLSDEQKADIYARTTFPSTEETYMELTFNGGPNGYFHGTHPENGEEIIGQLRYEDQEREMGAMHVVFTRGIQQDYLVVTEEPFYNWP